MPGKPADMHLVDDRVSERPSQGRIVLPVVGGRINDHALQRRSGIVPWTMCGLPAAPGGPGNAFPIRVEQHLIGVETRSLRQVEGAVDTIGVDLARGDSGHQDMPIIVGPVDLWVEVDDAGWAWRVRVVEQQQLRPRAMLGERAEVGAARHKRRSEREVLARVGKPKCRESRRYASLTIRFASAKIACRCCSSLKLSA